MLAIDPGTSIVNTGGINLIKGWDPYRWYQSIVLPVGFVNPRIGQKPLEK